MGSDENQGIATSPYGVTNRITLVSFSKTVTVHKESCRSGESTTSTKNMKCNFNFWFINHAASVNRFIKAFKKIGDY